MASFDAPDEELIQRIVRRDPEAVRALYARHGRMVYGIAAAIVGQGSEAEEVTQDVFLRAWEKAASYQPDKARVATWLARIARNRAIDVLRRARSRTGRVQDAGDLLDLMPDPTAADPLDSAEVSLSRRAIRAAVARLPEEQRRPLSLAFLGGLTHQEIAERLGQPLGTVKTRIRDGLHKLRDALGEERR